MHKIKIPKKVKVGGHDYRIISNRVVDRELDDNRLRGAHSECYRHIEIKSTMEEQETSGTFIHESTHAINVVYCGGRLTEDDVGGVSNGLHQILEQLGVRFIK